MNNDKRDCILFLAMTNNKGFVYMTTNRYYPELSKCGFSPANPVEQTNFYRYSFTVMQ